MLFSRRRGNERDIFEIALDGTSLFRGSCIDVIKSRLRKNLKAPASSRIIPFLKGEIRRRKSRLCKNLLNTVVTNKTHPGRKGPAILNINTKVAIGKYTNNSGTFVRFHIHGSYCALIIHFTF